MRDSLSCNRILALALGINEALVYNHIEYYVSVENTDNPMCQRDGRTWTYGDYEYLQKKYFSWMSVDTLKDVMKRLQSMKLITIAKYSVGEYARRNWYSHNPETTEKFLQFWRDNGSIPCSKREHKEIVELWITSENGKMPLSENGKMPLYNTDVLNNKTVNTNLNAVEQVYIPIVAKLPKVEKVKSEPKKDEPLSAFEKWLLSEMESVFSKPIKMPQSARKLLTTKRVIDDVNYLSPVEYFESPKFGDLFRKYIQYKIRVFKNFEDGGVVSFSVGAFIRKHVIAYGSKQGFIAYAQKSGYYLNVPKTTEKPSISTLYAQIGNYALDDIQIKNNDPKFYEFWANYDGDWDNFINEWDKHND